MSFNDFLKLTESPFEFGSIILSIVENMGNSPL